MEQHFAKLKIPDSPESDKNKLIRAASFSEMPSTRRVLVEQCYRDDPCNLIRQYSYEQIHDRGIRTSQVKISEMVQTGDDWRMKAWKNALPYISPNWGMSVYPSTSVQSNNDTIRFTRIPIRKNKQIEYVKAEDESNSTSLSRFAIPIAPTSATIVSTEKSLVKSENFIKPVAMKRKLNEGNMHRNERRNKKLASYQDMKDKIRPLARKYTPKNKTKCCCGCSKLIFVIIFSIFIALIAILLHQDQDIKHSSDFASAVVELRKRIHGQDNAVQTLSEYLQVDSSPLKMIALVGGTGVGKSYTIKIIKKNFPKPYFISQYLPPIGQINDIGFSFLYPKLIILENLKKHDLKDAVNFLKRRQKPYENRYITILMVFNVEQMEDNSTRTIDLDRAVDEIKSSFVDESIDVKIVPYDSLSEIALEKCITDAARDSELILSNNQIDLIKQYLLTNKAGCKGTYSKVHVIGRQ